MRQPPSRRSTRPLAKISRPGARAASLVVRSDHSRPLIAKMAMSLDVRQTRKAVGIARQHLENGHLKIHGQPTLGGRTGPYATACRIFACERKARPATGWKSARIAAHSRSCNVDWTPPPRRRMLVFLRLITFFEVDLMNRLRIEANLEVALESVCKKLPGGGNHEIREASGRSTSAGGQDRPYEFAEAVACRPKDAAGGRPSA